MKPVATRDLPIGLNQRQLLKEVLVRWNQTIQFVERQLGLTWLRKKLIKIYFALPPRFQYRLAKFGMKAVVRKKTAQLQELIRH